MPLPIQNKRISKHDGVLLFFCILLFLSRQETFLWIIRGQRLLMAITVVLSLYYLFNISFFRLFLRRGKFLLMTLLYLFIIFLFQHGNTSDLISIFSTYLFSTFIFIIGLNWGLNNKNRVFETFFFWLYTFTFLNLLPFVVHMLLTANFSKRALSSFFNLPDNPLIMLWPLFFIIGFSGYFVTQKSVYFRKYKRLLQFLFVIFILSLIVSSFTAVFMMFVIAISVFYFFKKKSQAKRSGMIYIVIIPIILYFGLNLVSSGVFGDLGGTAYKIEAFLNIFHSTSITDSEMFLNEATATRYSRFDYSFDSFLNSPVFGAGYVLDSSTVIKRIASNHSSIFDFLAYFGVFAFLFFGIFIMFIDKNLRLNCLYVNPNQLTRNYAILGLILSFCLMSFLNPYLNFSTIDLIFMLGGWSTGQIEYLKKRKAQLSD